MRAIYFSYVDHAADRRGLHDFEVLRDILRDLDPAGRAHVALEFVQVAVDRDESIAAAMARLVATRPAVIVATSDDVLAAARAATDSVPVLFASHVDPVAAGYVRSIAAPGVNRTGVTFHVSVAPKAIEILHDAYPATRRIGVVLDNLLARSPGTVRDLMRARSALGIDVVPFVATDAESLRSVLRSKAGAAMDAWYVPVGEALWNDEDAVLKAMRAMGKPVLYERTRLARKGGLLAYEPRLTEPFRMLATQLLLIAHGADPASIPVERPSEFELAVNLAEAGRHAALRPSDAVIKRANVVFEGSSHAE